MPRAFYDPERYTPEERSRFAQMEICILSPIGHAEPRWIRSMVNLVAYSWYRGLKVYTMAHTEREVVDWARNNLADAVVEEINAYTDNHYTHALWLDSDHVFNPDMACQLARHFVLPEVDMVSALYYGRMGKLLPVVYVRDFTEDEHKHFPIIEVPKQLAEVDAVGFGGMLMKRDVFLRVPKPWFTLDWKSGEDIAFCAKAKKHGIRIFVDGAYTMGHIGTSPIITEKDYRNWMETHQEELGEKIKVELGGKKHGR